LIPGRVVDADILIGRLEKIKIFKPRRALRFTKEILESVLLFTKEFVDAKEPARRRRYI
jgi:hypothetical protein